MSRSKKINKGLARNASVPFRAGSTKDKPYRLKKVQFAEDEPAETVGPNDFSSPEFCTLLHLAEELKKIKKSHFQSAHGAPHGPRYRNLNFMPQEKIFQDLVEIEVPEEQFVQETKSHLSLRVTSKKDVEPDFNKFLKYSLQPEYYFSSYAMPEIKKQKLTFNDRNIYNKVKLWKEQV